MQHLGIIFVNNQLDAQFFFVYIYFSSLHVSNTRVPIIRRIHCINTTSGICHSMYVTVWYTGSIQTCVPDSPDDEHMGARNIKRIEINIYEKEMCIKLVIYKNYGFMP